MTDRDRLIELIHRMGRDYRSLMDSRLETDEPVPPTFQAWLADHLLANGVIVPPCKVGDKIYMLVTRHTVCFEYPNGKMQKVKNQHTFIKETYLTKLNFFKVLDDFGKTVFLTKEEAEQKLKELNNNA